SLPIGVHPEVIVPVGVQSSAARSSTLIVPTRDHHGADTFLREEISDLLRKLCVGKSALCDLLKVFARSLQVDPCETGELCVVEPFEKWLVNRKCCRHPGRPSQQHDLVPQCASKRLKPALVIEAMDRNDVSGDRPWGRRRPRPCCRDEVRRVRLHEPDPHVALSPAPSKLTPALLSSARTTGCGQFLRRP